MSKYKAISYTRLSYTNEKDNESNSISNQKMLIRDFVKKHSDIEIVSEKVDDGYTVVLFAVIFFLILLNTLKQITVSKPIELLRSENAGEKPPKANWVMALAGVVIMAVAYYIAISIEEPMEAILWFFVAVVLVIIATYLLFIAGSVALCKLLQKNKNYYYKTNHFVSVSSMAFRSRI